jgi:hypothetical protein
VHPSSSPRAGIFFVRAWLDDRQLIARIGVTPDVARPAHTVVVAGPDAVVQALQAWLEDLSTGPPDAGPAPDPDAAH